MPIEIKTCKFNNENELPEDTPLYKYISTEGFLHLVEFKRLLFSRITSWPDSFEGSRYQFLNQVRQDSDFAERSRDDFYAMCWTLQTDDPRLFDHNSDYQMALNELQKNGSASMWENYCKNGGVRIKTTLRKLDSLFKSLRMDCQLFRGKVYYEPEGSLRTSVKAPTLISTLLHKRISFRHENEYRYILVPKDSMPEPIITIEIPDLFDLLDEILISPATSKNKWLSRTLYHVGVDLTLNKKNQYCVNTKNTEKFCRISQLYATVSQEIGYYDMI